MAPGVKIVCFISLISSLENGALVVRGSCRVTTVSVVRDASTGTAIPRSSMAVAACRSAIVHNLPEVPPVPGHLCRQDNHSLDKWGTIL